MAVIFQELELDIKDLISVVMTLRKRLLVHAGCIWWFKVRNIKQLGFIIFWFLKEKGGWVGESCEVAPQVDLCAERAVSGQSYGFARKAKGGEMMVSLKYKTVDFSKVDLSIYQRSNMQILTDCRRIQTWIEWHAGKNIVRKIL